MVVSFTGDGACDQDSVYADVAQRHPEAAVVVPPRSTAVQCRKAESEPTQQYCHLRFITEPPLAEERPRSALSQDPR